jgi:hypothetical protein
MLYLLLLMIGVESGAGKIRYSFPRLMTRLKNELTNNGTDHVLQAIDRYQETYHEYVGAYPDCDDMVLEEARNAFFRALEKNNNLDMNLPEVPNTTTDFNQQNLDCSSPQDISLPKKE